MSKRLFTREQIESLLKNKYVVRASEKSITYHANFKLFAVKRRREGLPPSAIFQEAGFNLALIGKETPKSLVTDWRRVFDAKGPAGLEGDNRGRHSKGRPPNFSAMSEKEKLKYLEAQVEYLKAENAFLAKLRKQRLN
ncbi:MAG: HTH domain-containing protein [Patescibacteria group bacterium]